jgi:hypothetical protein
MVIPKDYGFLGNMLHDSITSKLAFHAYLPLLLLKHLE